MPSLKQKIEDFFNPLNWLFPGYTSQPQTQVLIKKYVTGKYMLNNAVLSYKFRQKLIESEGDRNDVYRDSLGKLTVGIGHLVTFQDNLKLGDKISNARKEAFYRADSQKALDAAWVQAQLLGKENNEDFVVALAEVNYQLGTTWYKKFFNTWKHLKDKNWKAAINNLKESTWAKQTPRRVSNFINAIQEVYS